MNIHLFFVMHISNRWILHIYRCVHQLSFLFITEKSFPFFVLLFHSFPDWRPIPLRIQEFPGVWLLRGIKYTPLPPPPPHPILLNQPMHDSLSSESSKCWWDFIVLKWIKFGLLEILVICTKFAITTQQLNVIRR